MRATFSLISLVVTLAIGFFIYKHYLTQVTPAGAGSNPIQTISITGVQNDLIAIAQAERIYNAQNGSYGTLDQLTSSGSLSTAQSGRDGYSYSVETSAGGFTVTARHPDGPGPSHYPTLSIDQTMEIHRSD